MIERERKFLIKKMPEELIEIGLIRQGYLMIEKDRHLRVRIYDSKEFGDQAFLCYKQDIDSTSRYENEYEIPLEDAECLMSRASKILIKKRYYKTIGDVICHIDKYQGGLVVCELEYEDCLYELPDFVGKEITGIKKYNNINLAKCIN